MIEIKNLYKTYHLKTGDVKAVDNVSLTINNGEIYGVIGYSGAGKSTLVRCINLLETPDAGEVTVNGTKLVWEEDGKTKYIGEKGLKEVRRGIGMIFQHFNLLDRSTVFDNVAYPLKYSGLTKQQISERVFELLELVDLKEKAGVYPSQLSGGQKQRVAIARALANKPKILLSDEATSALDPEATKSILELLKKLNEKLKLTVILITHEMAVIKSICQKVAVMEKGRVVEEGNVYNIFAEPGVPITQNFIESQSSLSKIDELIEKKSPLLTSEGEGRLIKLLYRNDSVGDSLISDVSRRFNLNLNIVLATVEMLQNDPLGAIIVVVYGKENDITQALEYIKGKKVQIFELEKGGKVWAKI